MVHGMPARRRSVVVPVLVATLLSSLLLLDLPWVYADTFGYTSTSGMSTWAGSASSIYPTRFAAPSSGGLSSITFFATGIAGSVTGNAGIYADASGLPGALLAQGTPQTLMDGQNTFSSLSASVSIVSGTNYWLAFEMTGGSFYYGGTGLRGWGSATCCTMPSTVTVLGTAASSYAIYATYSVGPDFSIGASPPSQSVGAGSTATYTLSLTSSGGYSGTVTLTVTSGCPSSVTCSVAPNSVSSFPATATLSVPTLITTPGGTTSVVVTATDGTITHTVTVSLTVIGPASFNFNVKESATQIVVTLTYSWSGAGAPPSGTITIAGPGGTPTLGESGAVVYDRTSIAVSGGANTYALIHRVTFTIAAPGSAQVWTALVSLSGVSSYNLTIEVT